LNLFIAVVVAAIAGTHIATWGMYKDAPHEGYSHRKYARAIVLAMVLGFVSALFLRLNLLRMDNLVVFFGCIYAAERGLEELYKTFVREEDQSKYFIPMQFHILGRVVQNRLARWSMAAAWLLLALIVGVALLRLDSSGGFASQLAVVVLVGGVGGWMSAFGGAWKDGPLEGFDTLKFFRSPLVASCQAFLLAHLTPHFVLIAFAAAGYTVAMIETYKTFFFPGKPRGKFAGKPILYPDMLVRRQRFIPVYVAIWVLIIAGFVLALLGTHRGRL
jgi:hypothetical protein